MPNLMVINRQGVLYDDRTRGDVLALYVPARDQIRRYADLPNPNVRTVREQYGALEQTPLWRQEGEAVTVYGVLPAELYERRTSVEVFLPEDFAPLGTSVLFYVFSDQLIVHAVRAVSDNGTASWGSSRLDPKRHGGLINALVEAVSDRLLEGTAERILVAVHGEEHFYDQIRRALEPFRVELVRFETLQKNIDKDPLYAHRDYSLWMLTSVIFAALLVLLALGYLAFSAYQLSQAETKVAAIQAELQRLQTNTRLGSLPNPKEVLNALGKPLKQRPSAIVHAVGEVAATLGRLEAVEFVQEDMTVRAGRRSASSKPSQQIPGVLEVIATVKVDGAPGLLVDQERVALAAFESRPWVRYIQREGGNNTDTMKLRIGVQVE